MKHSRDCDALDKNVDGIKKPCNCKFRKQTRPRTVFGRVRVNAAGKILTVSLSKTHIVVRPLHARRTYKLKLTQAVLHIMANAPLLQEFPPLPVMRGETIITGPLE